MCGQSHHKQPASLPVLQSSSTHAASTGWQPALQEDTQQHVALVLCWEALKCISMHNAVCTAMQHQHPVSSTASCVVQDTPCTSNPRTSRCQCNPPHSAPFCIAAVCGSQILILRLLRDRCNNPSRAASRIQLSMDLARSLQTVRSTPQHTPEKVFAAQPLHQIIAAAGGPTQHFNRFCGPVF